jgi:geranylgeranyl diphosphate synthase type I
VELIHNASLVHDDIQDRDRTRRGKPSAWVTFSMEQAINLGDLLFVLGFEAFNRMDIPDSLKLTVMRLTIRAIGELCDGQVFEFVLKERSRVGVEDYIRLVSGKTGSLFRLACRGGYALADSGGPFDGQMREMGEHIGVMFQVRDDLLDAVGSKEGRTAGCDVAEGKISYPAVHFMSRATEEERREILSVLRTPREETTDADVRRVLSMYERAGSLRAALDEYHGRRDAVLELDCLARAPELAAEVRELLALLDPPLRREDL